MMKVKTMDRDLTRGNITKTMLLFAVPMILGNLLQQAYNIVDTLIVGRYLGADALAAVGSAYTLMTFLTSIILGLCMGSGTVFSIYYGAKKECDLKNSIFVAFVLIAGLTFVLNASVFLGMDPILHLLQVPEEIYLMLRDYLRVIFIGIGFTFFYNFFAFLLRAIGNSVVPLVFLGISAVINIVLDLLFVIVLGRGVAGAAEATVIAQGISAAAMVIYTFRKIPSLCPGREDRHITGERVRQIANFSFLTCVQQSVMNFGILMIQGLVNSFGTVVMAAFAAAVKIDSFAYMPVQDFGNAFSTFIAQNYGAGKSDRIRKGIKSAAAAAFGFCVIISGAVWLFAEPLMKIFVKSTETEIISVGVGYLRIEGACYFGIGLLFLLYGFYRAVKRPGMSVVLTIFSLGTRVALAYILSAVPAFGVKGIWVSVPIGWVLADFVGVFYYYKYKNKLVCIKTGKDGGTQ